MKRLYLRQLFLSCCASLFCSILCLPYAYSNNPCTAYVYEFNNGVRDTVPCGNAANTVSNIDIDAAGPTDFQLSENCAPVLATPNDYVAWFTFIIQEGGSSFEWQIIETGRDDVNYEIYYSNDPGGPNECTDLTFYHCGDHFVSWELLGVPDPSQSTRFYVAVYTEKADNDVDVNLKFRKACGEACNNSDMSVVAAEDRCVAYGESTVLAASPSGGGGEPYTYLWSPNDGTIDNIHSPIPTVNPTETTTYTVQVRGADGCPAFDQVTVQVGECCLAPPQIECPPRYVGCPTSSLDPYVTGSPEIIYSEESCSDVKFIYSDEVLSVDASCPGAQKIKRTWTATYYDFPDLTTTCEQKIVLKDTKAPVIKFDDPRLQDLVTGDTIWVECDTIMPFSMESAVVTDNCDDDPLVEFVDYVSATGDCAVDRFNWIMDCRWIATDKCGNSSDFQIIVIIEDTTPPQAVYTPADVTTTCGAIPAVETPEFFENCSYDINVEFSETNTADECEGSYTIIRKWTATDVCNNESTITQTITVVDDVAPVLHNVPSAQTVSCDEIPAVPTNIEAYDNCDENVQIDFNENIQDGDCAGNYTIVRTWTATDNCGNQTVKNQAITVEDNTPPSFWDVPQNVAASCDNIPTVATNISASDNCDDNVQIDFNENIQNGTCAGNYTIIRKWTATDDCGNAKTVRQTITVTDDVAPVLQNIPNDVNAECSDIPAVPNVTATDNCDENVEIIFNESVPEDADCASGYTITRTWKAIDDCGNQSVATQTITVRDNTAPEFWDVPNDVNAECGDIPAVPNVTATDNCDDNVEIIFNENVPNDADCASGYTITRTWKAIDDCGNQSVATQTITVRDNTAPEFWDIPNDVNAECGEIPAVPNVTATDNCDENVEIIFNESVPNDADCASGYTITRTWKAIDDCGNQSVATQTITVRDNTAPVLQNVPDNASVSCDNIPTPANVTATDNCDNNVAISFTESVQTGDCAGESTITRKWIATDDCGNQSFDIQLITTYDNTAPVLQNVPENVTVSCDAVPAPANVIAVDNCDENVQVVLKETITELDCAGKFNVRRKWTATDACGNKTTAVQTIKARDTTKPIFNNAPENDTISCGIYPEPAQLTTIDNCDNNVTIEYTETVTEMNCGDKLIRQWIATDACGNKTTHKQIIRRKDETAPVFSTTPANVTVSCEEIPAVTPPTVTDDCDNDLNVVFTEKINAGSCAGNYNIIRKWVATDNCGNKSTAKQTIKVRDRNKPVLVGVPNNLTTTCSDYPAPANVTATDDCDGEVTVSFTESFSAADCGDRIVRKWTATDACGNHTAAQQIITRTDTDAPVLVGVPNDDVQNCGTVVDPPVVTAQDDCDSDIQVIFEEENLGGECGGEIIRKWTATDNCGNTTTATQRISRSDDIAPTLQNVPNNLTVECDNIPTPANVTAYDNCDRNVEISFTESILEGDCKGEASVTRKWIATDDCGNQSFDIQIITVVDNTPPTLNGVPANSENQCGAGGYQLPPLVTASDNCDDNINVVFGEEIVDGDCGDDLIRKWTATDDCGNTVSKIQRISFVDTEAPVFWDCPNDIVLNGQDGCQVKGTWGNVSATDNCTDNVSVTTTHPSGTTFPLGTTTVTYTAVDNCGNVSYCSFDVTVTGEFMLHCPADVTVDCNEDGGAFVTWTPPTGASCCMSCNENPEIANFLYMGTYGGHRYYCSRDRVDWHTAKATAENMGGHLAVINDAAENQYLTSFLGNQNAFIGLTDEGTEGNFRWLNGDPVTYTNWRADQPNNHENRQHYGQLLNTGKWNDTYATDQLEYIVEIPCLDIRQIGGTANGGFFPIGTNTITYKMTDECGNMETCDFTVTVEENISISCPDDIVVECDNQLGGAHVNWIPPTLTGCCSDCPENPALSGFVYMGTRNGHRYYCSRDKANWQTAQAICQQRGGHLAVINDAEENAFLTTFLVTQRAYIGLTDAQNEGQFAWVNGDPLIYTNWYPNEPDNNNGNQDYAELMNNGQWNDTDGQTLKEYILELPCNDPVLVDGYANGSLFPAGTTTVTYRAADNCGNVANCSFDVTVQHCTDPNPPSDYCEAEGNNTSHVYINKVNTTAFNNTSGNNQGYADFTNLVTTVTAGQQSTLAVYPGFYNTRRYVYWRVWIDYNQDGDFDDYKEQIFQYREYRGLRINFTVPANAVLGETRMRVAMSAKGYPSSCGTFDYGEVEDYTIVVTGSGRQAISPRQDAVADVAALAPQTEFSKLPFVATDLTETTVQIFPNPAREVLNLQLSTANNTASKVLLFNYLGELVRIEQVASGDATLQLDVAHLARGVYQLVIEQENHIQQVERVVLH